MTDILAEDPAREGPLPAVRAEDGMALRPDRIHGAPPNHHRLVERGRLRLAERWHDASAGVRGGYEERALERDHTAAMLRTLLSGQVRTPYVPGTEPEPGPPA